MAEVTTRTAPAPETGIVDRAAVARLRALSRPGRDPRDFLKTISPLEIAAVAGLLLLVVATALAYSYWILPDQVRNAQSRSELQAAVARREELQKQLEDPTALRTEFERVRESLDSFRGGVLKPRLAGRLEIIDAVDRISRETGVRLTSPVAFSTSLTAEDLGGEQQARARQKEGIGSYPSLGMSFSISGGYPQVRNFISRFEASRQFVVIDAVGIGVEGSSDTETLPRAAARNDRVALQITMTAYFQPEAAAVEAAQ